MGKVLLVCRLAVKDIRHRPAQAILLLLAIAAGATTLALGLALQGTANNPYARTRATTNGPDVVATVFPNGPNGPNGPGPATSARPGGPGGPGTADVGGLVPLEHASGVAAHSGPFPVMWTLLRTGHTTGSAEVEGRSTAPSSVDRPKLIQGTWVRPGGVVVEAAFANALGLRVGDRLSLGGSSFEVAGTAVTAAIPDYPDVCSSLGCFLANSISSYNPGLVWATEADAEHIAHAPTSTPLAYFLNLKLNDPAGAIAFADRYNASASPAAPFLYSWQSIRDGDAQVIAKVQLVLFTGSWLLALLAIASVVVLVGGRMAEQTRRVGLLKAVGGTPRLVAVVLLFEHVLVGLCAAGVGLAAGWLTAPLLDGPGAGLVGAPSAPSLSGSTAGLVVALALAVAIVATFVPAIRAARQSTVAALEDSAQAPRRRAAVIRLSAHLPATLLLGARIAVRRPRRLLLSVFSVAVTASGLVAVLALHATAGGFLGSRVAQATTIISVMLVILAAVNAVFIGWATALDARHPAALARALGATPAQITTGLSVAQLLPALVGALLGIPGGIGIYDVARNGRGATTVPPALWLVVMVLVTLLAVAVLTAIPARIGARRPVAEVLQAEAA
ncbi:MAG: FtsX-like permease family protein [Streptosporangiaceae bacterium]|jgi:ABC-type lipoprotein release transport system permease subunit